MISSLNAFVIIARTPHKVWQSSSRSSPLGRNRVRQVEGTSRPRCVVDNMAAGTPMHALSRGHYPGVTIHAHYPDALSTMERMTSSRSIHTPCTNVCMLAHVHDRCGICLLELGTRCRTLHALVRLACMMRCALRELLSLASSVQAHAPHKV